MKRFYVFFAVIAMTALLLAGCNNTTSNTSAPTSSSTNTSGETSTSTTQIPNQTQTESDPPQDGRGDIFEEQAPGGADVIRQGVYYYELTEFSGDYGDGLSPKEGAELTDELLASIGLYTDNGGISAWQCVYISFDELAVLDSAMGRECYLYSVGIGTPEGGLMGDGYEVIYRVSVDYSGDKTAAIYEDFSGGRGDLTGRDDGRGDTFDDIGDGEMYTDAPSWDGEYIDRDAGFSITVTNFNGVSFFDFEIYLLRNGGDVLEGKATISPDTDYTAEYGEMSFVLYADNSAIELFAPEGSEWAHLSGNYERMD